MSYRAFDRLTAPGRDRAALWRLVLGLVLAAAVTLGLSRAIFVVASLTMSDDGYWTFVADVSSATTPLGLFVLLFGMGAMGIGATLAARILHHRSFRSLVGPPGLAVRQFFRVGVAVVALYGVVALVPPWEYGEAELQPGLRPGLWLMLLPLTCLALLVQTGSEELLFRGYMQSQLGARFGHPVIWLTVPAALFAFGHYAPATFGSNALAVAAWAFVFGVIAADLTARSGTLGPAVALHFVNNFSAIALTSLQGEMSGLALYKLPFGPEDEAALFALLPLDLGMALLSWLAARVAIRA